MMITRIVKDVTEFEIRKSSYNDSWQAWVKVQGVWIVFVIGGELQKPAIKPQLILEYTSADT
jgi:hypothetical protein